MILLSPWSRVTTQGQPSPKNYPWWEEVVSRLADVWQISCAGEPVVKGCTKRFDNLTLAEIVRLLRECRTWMSVDNMFQHLAWSIGHRGVVVFGPSDPLIFGHAENVNLLRDRKFLRDRQFGLWSEIPWQPEIFSPPDAVVRAVESIMSMNARL